MTQSEHSRRPVTIAQANRLVAGLILYAVYLITAAVLCSGPAGGLALFLLISAGVTVIAYAASLLSILAFLLAMLAFAALMRWLALHELADAAEQFCKAGDALHSFVVFCLMLALPAAALVHYL